MATTSKDGIGDCALALDRSSDSVVIAFEVDRSDFSAWVLVVTGVGGRVRAQLGTIVVQRVGPADPPERIVAAAWMPGATAYSVRAYPQADPNFRTSKPPMRVTLTSGTPMVSPGVTRILEATP